MKKTLICLLVLAFAGFLSAANNAAVTTTGSNNNATIDQVGSNGATATQTGDYNLVDVDQTGDNTASISQASINGGTAGKGNQAGVMQNGSGNETLINQDRSGGQQSKVSLATSEQTGDNNLATINQTGNYQGSNKSSVTQHGITGGLGNTAEVNQMGYGNTWDIKQAGDQNYALQQANSVVHSGTTNKIEQDGLSNEAYQYTSGSDAMKATIAQVTGVNDNYAIQTQAGLKAEAVINQFSNSNTAIQEQYHGSYKHDGVYARSHLAVITQTGGENNYAKQYQDETVGDSFANSRNESTIYQNGGDNTATVSQYDGLSVGNVTQTGNLNNATIEQSGLINNADITQTGNGNTATVTQADGVVI